MRRLTAALPALVLCAWLAGCAAPTPKADSVPLLRLPPAALQRELDLQQQITVRYRTSAGETQHDVLAVLQADAGHTRLAAVAGTQVLARLDWDGERLQVVRSPWAPAELVPERILSDLQLALWPSDAIAAALPPGWELEAAPDRRVLRRGTETVADIRYPDADTIVLAQHHDGYTLTIRTLRAPDSQS